MRSYFIVGLISSLALGAAVLSAFIQRKELELQREEMKEMRKEATAQRLAAQELASATAGGEYSPYEGPLGAPPRKLT